MIGPLVNALGIVVCALIGTLAGRGIPARFQAIVKKAAALATLYIGLKGALESQNTLLLVLCLVVGAVIGEAVNIDGGMRRLGAWAERAIGRAAGRGGGKQGAFQDGFVQASLLFCTGSMAIVGSMQSGIAGDYDTLVAKTVLDGAMAVVMAATLGGGVVFSGGTVLAYEGGIALVAMGVGGQLSTDMVREMSAVGGLTIAAIGYNFLEIREIKVANLIPGIFLPIAWYAVANAVT
jgi:uncharacterized membrane protein YqgA involved in biofilm formation